MRRCVRNGNITAFGVGLLAGVVLPNCWIAVVAAILLVVMSFANRRCMKFC